MPSSSAARKRRAARRQHRADPTQPQGVGISAVSTLPEVLAQLRADMAQGLYVDPSALDGLAIGAAIDGKSGTAMLLSNLANGRRLEELLAELEAGS